MRNLSAELIAAQKASSLNPYPKITCSLPGESDIVLERDRILHIPAHEESEDNHTAQVVLSNADKYFNNKNLKGWNAVIEWGLETTTGIEYSATAPLKIVNQTLSSDERGLFCYLTLMGIPNMISEDKASGDYINHKSSTKTVKTLLTEVVTATPTTSLWTEEQTLSDSTVAFKSTTFEGSTYDVIGVGQRLSIPDRLVTKLAFRFQRTGLGADLTLGIYDWETEAELASGTISGLSISTWNWYEVEFSTPVQINKVIDRNGEGGVYIAAYQELPDSSNYISARYLSYDVKPNENLVLLQNTTPVFVEWADLEVAYRYAYIEDGIEVYSHCSSYDVVFDSEDSLIDTYQPKDSFRIREGDSRLSIINRLLNYTECVKRWEDDGKLHVFVPVTSGTTYDFTSSLAEEDHKFFSKSTRESLVIPNRIVVRSYEDDENQYSGEYTSTESYALLPKSEFIRTRLTSDSQARDIAEARIKRLEVNSQRGSARIPINVGAEVHDYVNIVDARLGDSRSGNIGSLRRSYLANKSGPDAWSMQFSFGKVSIKGVMGTRPSLFEHTRPLQEIEDETVVRWGFLRDQFERRTLLIWEGDFESNTAGINNCVRWLDELDQKYNAIASFLGISDVELTEEEKIEMALMDYMSLNLYNTKSQIKVTQPTRALNTVYQNTTGRPLYVAVVLLATYTFPDASLKIGATDNPTTIIDRINAEELTYVSISGFVPKDFYYTVTSSYFKIHKWTETQIGI